MDVVTPWDAPGRYIVQSEVERKGPYHVDLLAWDGEGQCDCPDWENRIGPYLRRETHPEKRFCKHIIKAREFMLDAILRIMIDAEKRPKPDGKVDGRPVKLLRHKVGVWAEVEFLDTNALGSIQWNEFTPKS